MQLALYQPDIPQNVGSIFRLCACFDVVCHIIEPCGFIFDEKRIRATALDYFDQVRYERHASWEAFLISRLPASRLILMTSKASSYHHEFAFRPDDILLMGRESAGVPDSVRDQCGSHVRIPIKAGTRSLNVANAASIVMAECLRQTEGFPPQP
jgi:tRNA (cytidine/uridine-2'-O-)-methyltransferase